MLYLYIFIYGLWPEIKLYYYYIIIIQTNYSNGGIYD